MTWVAYQSRDRRTLRCRLWGHKSPPNAPEPPNGIAPSNYTRCGRRHCRAFLKWLPADVPEQEQPADMREWRAQSTEGEN